MNYDRRQRVDELFEKALFRAPDERESFLAEACGDDPTIRAEVISLLEHDEQAPAEFMRPPDPAIRSPLSSSTLEVGAIVGGYRITGLIASGGMGTVYEAVQKAPQRVVALKIMLGGMASRSALGRFQLESAVLARLHHPNIAQVFDAGVQRLGESRIPYFAMEYIAGARTVTAFAQEENLCISDRLALFATICDAVHHGHQKGIIHRDIKPANILVDSSGRPKVIDFGIARATDLDLAITAQQTITGQLIGTMQYMSPEQCDADPHALDIRTDIYSLGVVLYELLTGESPYVTPSANIYEAARTICEQPPKPPSRVDPELEGDVETIVLKALEKERERRYQSAAELASDIRRFLKNEPILARRTTALYQLRLYARRHRVAFRAIVAAAIGLCLATVISVWSAIEATAQRRVAEAARDDVASKSYAVNLTAAEAALAADDPATARIALEGADPKSRGWEWRYLRNRVDQSIRTLMQVDTAFEYFSVDKEGQQLAVALKYLGVVRVYDIRTGKIIHELPTQEPCAVAFSNDGTLLAVASTVGGTDRRGTIALWRLDTASSTLVAHWIVNDVGAPMLAFHPTRRILAGGRSGDHPISLWDLRDLERFESDELAEVAADAVLQGHKWEIRSLAFSPRGDLLASGSHDYTVRLWDVESSLRTGSGRALAVLRGHTYYVEAVAFSPDGCRLASASTDKTIRVWDVAKSIEESAGKGGSQSEGDKAPGVQLGVLGGHDEGFIAVAFDSTGSRLVSGGNAGLICVWDVADDAIVSDLQRSQTWRRPRYQQTAALRGHEGWVRRVAYLPDGQILSGAGDESIRLWRPEVRDVPQLHGHSTSIDAVAFLPDNQHVVSGDGSGCLIVWDAKRCVPVAKRYFRERERVNAVTPFRRDDRLLLAVATGRTPPYEPGGRIILLDVTSPEAPRRVQVLSPDDGIKPSFHSIAVSADTRRLAAGDGQGVVRVWELDKQLEFREVCSLAGPRYFVNDLVFLHDSGSWLVSAGGTGGDDVPEDFAIRIWNADTGNVATARGHDQPIHALAMDPPGQLLASASFDRTVVVWRVVWEGSSPRLERAHTLEGHATRVYSVAFHPSEPRLCSGSQDGIIKLWDTDRMVEVATLREQVGQVADLTFDATGVRLATTSVGFMGTDNVARVWDAPNQPDSSRYERLVVRADCARALAAVSDVLQTPLASPAEAKRKVADRLKSFPDSVRHAVLDNFAALYVHPGWADRRAGRAVDNAEVTEEELLQALEWANLAAQTAPENGTFLAMVGIIEYRLGRHSQALATLSAAAGMNHSRLPAVWAVLAMTYRQLGEPDKAADAQKRMEELDRILSGLDPVNRHFVDEARASRESTDREGIAARR